MEYIFLFLVIAVLMKLIVSPMGRIFAGWTKNLVGPYNPGPGYYGCLMEKGLLPQGPSRPNLSCQRANLAFHLPKSPHTYTPHTYTPHTYTPHTYTPHTYTPHTYTPHTYTPHTYTPHTYTPHTYTPPGGGGGDFYNGRPGGGSPFGKGRPGGSSFGQGRSGRSGTFASGTYSSGSGGSSATAGFGGAAGGGGSGDSLYGSGGGDAGLSGGRGRKGKKGRGKRGRKGKFRDRAGDLADNQYQFQTVKGGGGRFRRGRRRIRIKRGRGFLGRQFHEAEETVNERTPTFPVAKTTVTKKDHTSGGEKKHSGLKFKQEQNTTKTVDVEIEEKDYGKFLKYLIFAAIIIAVIVLIGSQILEFQNRD